MTTYILDIGSGNNPYKKADVLCDKYLEDVERSTPLKRDNRPFILCDLEFLPFKGKSFDLIICQHILEHVDNPLKALEEIRRVGKSAYITTPSWIAENYMYRLRFHKSVIICCFGKVYILDNKYFNPARGRNGIRQAPEPHSFMMNIKRKVKEHIFRDKKECIERFMSTLNKFTGILTTTTSINGGREKVDLKLVDSRKDKIIGLYFLVVSTLIQGIRDALYVFLYLKRRRVKLKEWRIK